jgi:HD superfamily phosphohydrolase
MDRLDYLSRDSFYTGVSEGIVSANRIINMLSVVDNQLVVEEKGIYSIENFVIARRLMYWQVYLHKTVLAAETLLRQIISRAVYLANKGVEIYATPFLEPFIKTPPSLEDFEQNLDEWLEKFTLLDDTDMMVSIKAWQFHPDKVLSILSKGFIERKLPKIVITPKPVSQADKNKKLRELKKFYKLNDEEVAFMMHSGWVENNAYKQDKMVISIVRKNGTVSDASSVSDNYNLNAFKKTVKKYFFAYMRTNT